MSLDKTEKEKKRPELLRTALGSLTQRGSTFWRTLCAAVIVALTFWMTYKNAPIPVEWDTVFLVVIGYYFKDRPLEEKLQRARAAVPRPDKSAGTFTDDEKPVIGEMTYQFILATLLILGAIAVFIWPERKISISAGWIGGVILAVGFYFKESSIEALAALHERFRLFVALEVIAVTVPLVLVFVHDEPLKTPVPLQWVAVVLIVITFYFKEKKTTA
jgi:hypothetical protein